MITNKKEMKENFYEVNEGLNDLVDVEPCLDDEDNNDNAKNIKGILKEARMTIYKDSSTNRLQAVLMLLNICIIFGVSNVCVDKLLKMLKHDILPKENTCPPSHYKTKKMVKKLDLSYNTIYACKNKNCLLMNSFKDAKECSKCKESQYVSKLQYHSSESVATFSSYPSFAPNVPMQAVGWAYDVTC